MNKNFKGGRKNRNQRQNGGGIFDWLFGKPAAPPVEGEAQNVSSTVIPEPTPAVLTPAPAPAPVQEVITSNAELVAPPAAAAPVEVVPGVAPMPGALPVKPLTGGKSRRQKSCKKKRRSSRRNRKQSRR